MLIGLAGLKQSGKNSVANIIGGTHLAFGDALKQMAIDIDIHVQVGMDQHRMLSEIVEEQGWEQAKGFFEVRRFLQRLGTEGVRKYCGHNFWVNYLTPSYKDHKNRLVVVTDVRFNNEAESIRAFGGYIWQVEREGIVPDGHDSEKGIDQTLVEETIKNNGSLDDLEKLVLTML